MMTDENRLADPVAGLTVLPPGSAVVLRHRDGASRASLARVLSPAAKTRGVRLLIANDWRLAETMMCHGGGGMGGLHLSEAALRRGPGHWRRLRRRPGVLITAAAHDARAVAAAGRAGVDAILLAPVLATTSHPGARHLGVLRFGRLAAAAGMPVFALGGIDMNGLRRLARAGAAGIAGIGLFDGARRADLERFLPIFPKRRKSCIKMPSDGGQPNG